MTDARAEREGEAPGDAERFVAIAFAYGLAEAYAAIARLRAAGIPVHTSDLRTASVAWNWTVALGGIDLQVPAMHAADAVAVLRDGDPLPDRRRSALSRAVMMVGFLLTFIPPPAAGLFVAEPRPPARALRSA